MQQRAPAPSPTEWHVSPLVSPSVAAAAAGPRFTGHWHQPELDHLLALVRQDPPPIERGRAGEDYWEMKAVALGTQRTLGTLRTPGTVGTVGTAKSLGTLGTIGTLGSLKTVRTLKTLGTL